MIPGAGIPGVHAIGQISDRLDAAASGVLFTTTTSISAGTSTAGASVSGVILQAVSSINTGVTAGGALAQGVTNDVSSTLIAGEAIGTEAGDGDANGSTIVVQASFVRGLAIGATGTVRVAGGSAFTRSRHTAPGAIVTVSTSIVPGKAQIGHEVVVKDQHGRTTGTVVIFGATDEQLRSDELAIALLTDDWDWLAAQQGKAA